jgi:hypothetical protein
MRATLRAVFAERRGAPDSPSGLSSAATSVWHRAGRNAAHDYSKPLSAKLVVSPPATIT